MSASVQTTGWFGGLARAAARTAAWAAALFAAALLAAETVVICGACGHEAAPGAAACAHCGAVFPPPPPPVTNAPAPVVEAPAGLVPAPFDAVREDVQRGRELVAARPAVALAVFENALALMAIVKPGDAPADAGTMLVGEIERCRAAMQQADRTCPACKGTGKREVPVATLDGQPTTASKIAGATTCQTCGGSGRVAGVRNAAAWRLVRVEGRREHELLQRGAGRVPLGPAWVPATWPDKLTVRQRVAVSRAAAVPCDACGGCGRQDCDTCAGTGSVRCRAPGCRDGWVDATPANSLSPKTQLKQRQACKACQGTGRVTCADCQGERTVACARCAGTGRASACTRCSGEGLLPCPKCAGGTKPGAATCAVCSGEGVVLCGTCSGTGRKQAR